MLPQILVVVSATIIFVLGLLHLLYTFRGRRLHPRDPALESQMKTVSPIISRETTMWKAWVGFNASHSYGALLFGAIYGYLALSAPEFLFQSIFLAGLGLAFLLGYVMLGKLYWFSVPLLGIVAATICYLAALIARLFQGA